MEKIVTWSPKASVTRFFLSMDHGEQVRKPLRTTRVPPSKQQKNEVSLGAHDNLALDTDANTLTLSASTSLGPEAQPKAQCNHTARAGPDQRGVGRARTNGALAIRLKSGAMHPPL